VITVKAMHLICTTSRVTA